MSLQTTRNQRRQLAKDNARMPAELIIVPRDQWPDPFGPQRRVFRSRDFLVQEFDAQAPAIVRLSVNRTTMQGDRWEENIPWDDLQRIKSECGYPMADAVEIYPAQDDVVNVANMRHLWIMADKLTFAWRKRL